LRRRGIRVADQPMRDQEAGRTQTVQVREKKKGKIQALRLINRRISSQQMQGMKGRVQGKGTKVRARYAPIVQKKETKNPHHQVNVRKSGEARGVLKY